ncbi:50S ribosomal protein L4 [Candidatus Roizmanbacteria bacterium]|nr:50S ribosomal protein L4 [Candidatus Roizmanbacteria bacterium]
MPRTKKISEKKIRTGKTKAKAGLTIPVYGLDGKEKGTLELPKEIFSVEARPKLLAQYVRVYLANRRQGTASTKTRGEVTGSTRKIYRQKGTGRARHGDIKAPIYVGGGVVGGPSPRDFSLKLNKKQTRKALFYALTLKLQQKDILGLDNEFLTMKSKTKTAANFLKSLDLNKQRTLIVLQKMEKNNLLFSFRNLPKNSFIDAKSINAYEVLKNGKILIVQEALPVLVQHFLRKHQTS